MMPAGFQLNFLITNNDIFLLARDCKVLIVESIVLIDGFRFDMLDMGSI